MSSTLQATSVMLTFSRNLQNLAPAWPGTIARTGNPWDLTFQSTTLNYQILMHLTWVLAGHSFHKPESHHRMGQWLCQMEKSSNIGFQLRHGHTRAIRTIEPWMVEEFFQDWCCLHPFPLPAKRLVTLVLTMLSFRLLQQPSEGDRMQVFCHLTDFELFILSRDNKGEENTLTFTYQMYKTLQKTWHQHQGHQFQLLTKLGHYPVSIGPPKNTKATLGHL